jgi:xanthine dehydrogenase accessory factor
MRDVLPVLERWSAEGKAVALATVVRVERSAPRAPGATLALADTGEIAGSVTGGCVEPAVLLEAEAVLAGEPARTVSYGIDDELGRTVGLTCGGTVWILVSRLDPAVVAPAAAAVADDRPLGVALAPDGSARVVEPGDAELGDALARGESELVGETFLHALVQRPALYVFGAVDHAAALARVGRFLGYRVTVCDARARFVTPERFPDADELVVAWPDELLARAPVDERTAICVLTHDAKFDVPALVAALRSPAAYVGAMGSRKTTDDRAARLREAGVTDEELARLHAPIGLPIGARTPEEVAVAIGAEIVAVTRRAPARSARTAPPAEAAARG